jgi:hypothetical protein
MTDTAPPRQPNQPATWAEYRSTRTYHGAPGHTRFRATEKPRSIKATARTFRRETKRVPGGRPLPCADLRRGGIRSPLAFPLEETQQTLHAASPEVSEPSHPRGPRRSLVMPLAMVAAALGGGALR